MLLLLQVWGDCSLNCFALIAGSGVIAVCLGFGFMCLHRSFLFVCCVCVCVYFFFSFFFFAQLLVVLVLYTSISIYDI